MGFMQTESVLQTKNRSRPAKNRVFCSPASVTRECDPTYSHFGLSQGTNKINKHNHFKEIRG